MPSTLAFLAAAVWAAPLLSFAAPMRLIGASWGRTGTSSMVEALKILGIGPCIQMVNIVSSPMAIYQWGQIARIGDSNDQERREWINRHADREQIQCSLDFPGSIYFQDYMALYPNVTKVFINVRDSPQQYFDSASKTILRFIDGATGADASIMGIGHFLFFRTNPLGYGIWYFWSRTWVKLFPKGTHDETAVKKAYSDWIASVKARVPKDRLLEFNVKQGWGPLCEFLGVPVPKEPFPHINDTQEMMIVLAVFSGLGWITAIFYGFLASVVVRRCSDNK